VVVTVDWVGGGAAGGVFAPHAVVDAVTNAGADLTPLERPETPNVNAEPHERA